MKSLIKGYGRKNGWNTLLYMVKFLDINVIGEKHISGCYKFLRKEKRNLLSLYVPALARTVMNTRTFVYMSVLLFRTKKSEFDFSVGAIDSSLLRNVQTVSEVQPSTIQLVSRAVFLVK
jgi:hypothetical protein